MLEPDPAFIYAVNRVHAALCESFVTMSAVQALMVGDLFTGQPVREISEYVRELKGHGHAAVRH